MSVTLRGREVLPGPGGLRAHLREHPADLALTEQVCAAAGERGVHCAAVRLDDLHETRQLASHAEQGEL